MRAFMDCGVEGEGCWFSSISIYESNSEKEPLLLWV